MKGLAKYSGTAFIKDKVTERLVNEEIFSIFEDSKGKLWFGTKNGAYCFNGTDFIHYTSREGLSDNRVRNIVEDNKKRLWFATDSGVNQLEDSAFHSYTTSQGLIHNKVNWITMDHEKNLWFATNGGLSQFRGKAFTYFTSKDGLASNAVWSIWEHPGGDIWLSTEQKVSRISPGKGSGFSISESKLKWPEGNLYPFFKDRKGNLWFGTGKGIFRYDLKTFFNINLAPSLKDVNVLSIYEDSKGNFWFGTEQDGVLMYNGKEITYFPAGRGLLDAQVNAVIEDFQGNMWFGTNEGISVLNPIKKSFRNITTTQGWLTNRCVNTFLKDNQNNLWIGTYGGGVIKYSPPMNNKAEKTDTFSTNDGMIDNEVLLMIFDNNGNLWIGTNKGITMLDIDKYSRTGKKAFKYYGKEEGLTGMETNQNAVFKDHRGNLWFGTIRGAVKYTAKEDRTITIQPQIHITNIKLFTREGDISNHSPHLNKKLEIPYNSNRLTVEYIGISLMAPEQVKYSTKLEGFDQNWSLPGNIPFATYSNLPAGDYTFIVKACNRWGAWTKDPASFSFRILAPFWLRWWFIMLGVVSIVGIVFIVIVVRERQLKRQKRHLEDQIHLHTLQLEKEKAKVELINLELEQRVEERTRKLEFVNKQLIQAQKMEAIGTLAGGVAHDLNNIMAGIINYPELMMLELPPDHSLRKYIIAIQRTGEKASSIVQDLLTLARRGVSVKEIVSLNTVVREFIESPEFEKILSYHPWVKIETFLDANLKNILGSPIHLSKTVMNLISNGAEAIPNQGTLRISTSNIFLDLPVAGYNEVAVGDYVLLSVTDSGVGMSHEDMERIFEPFYTKKKMGKSGTGLGMSVVWGSVKDHNGYIEIKSKEGEGTTFNLYFPSTLQRLLEKESRIPMDQLKGNGETILVIDDVEEQREITSTILKQLGYSVHTVSSGEEAAAFVKQNPAQLLVMDMIMDPGINGLETYKRILQISPNQKAIIVSGYSETAEVKDAQQLGAGIYLRKPYGMEKLGLAVKNELSRRVEETQGKTDDKKESNE